jgi:DNA-binding LacI/PurR family transcriptional regulator
MLMEEIARLAGVSTATVSRVMHRSPLVSPRTAQRVREIMEKAHYFPNNTATSLKSGISRIYGLIIPDITNPFFPEFIKAFETIAVEKNQEILLANTDFHPTGMEISIRRLLTRQVEGIALLVSEVSKATADALAKNRVPLVTFDRRGVSDVAIDNWPGFDQAIEHLKALRHTRIAYIGGTVDEPVTNHRLKAFVRALKKHDLVVYPELVRPGDWRIGGGESAMAELLSLDCLPTAIIGANDLTAIGAIRVLHERGHSIPGDFSVIGFDDIEFSRIVSPHLTTMALPRSELAARFFEALQAFGRSIETPGSQYAVKSRLVVRQSTARRRQFVGRNGRRGCGGS